MTPNAQKIKVIKELSHVVNCNSLDTQCNMPDFIIGAYLYESLQALMNTNVEYVTLSAQEKEN